MIKKLSIFIIAFFMFLPNVFAKNEVNLYFFYSEICYTCKAQAEWLENIKEDYPNLNVISLEITRNSDNEHLLYNVRKALNNRDITIPYTVIGQTGITGFNTTVENQIIAAIEKFSEIDHHDVVYIVENNLDTEFEIIPPEGEFNLPFLGNIDPRDISLPLISIVIGVVDGFNPCAMWVLLFLITMLFNMKDRKRMWILGFTFLGATAVFYFLVMFAWLHVAISLTSIAWIRALIGIVAITGGSINFRSYLKARKKDSGCEIVDDKKRKKMFDRIRKFTSQKKLIIAMIGIIGLAVSVNAVELACSAGLPLIYTQILALNDLNGIQYLMYLLLYILAFSINEIIIFVVAMKTLSIKSISTKFTKYSHLVGGIIMLLLGLLLIFKPEWIMFSF